MEAPPSNGKRGTSAGKSKVEQSDRSGAASQEDTAGEDIIDSTAPASLDDTSVRGVGNPDVYMRMNYLLQLYGPTCPPLARHYAALMNGADIKRSLCKFCDTVLVPGVTASVRLSPKNGTRQVITCLTCQTTKKTRMIAPRDALHFDPPAKSAIEKPKAKANASTKPPKLG